MATPFTSAQKAAIRLALGWSARFHQMDSGLEQAMSAIEGESDDSTHDQVVALLTTITDIETRLTDAYGRLKAKKVGSIDLPGAQEVSTLRSEGRRAVGKLARILSVEVRGDPFSPALRRDNEYPHG
jgi:hypothetical protein